MLKSAGSIVKLPSPSLFSECIVLSLDIKFWASSSALFTTGPSASCWIKSLKLAGSVSW